MVEPLIRLENVGVRFGRQEVLRHLSFTVMPHETVAIIGESGCGKSVTLKLIVGLLQPTTGTVYFEGRPVGSMNERELVAMRLRVGFLFQGAALFDSLNVYENISFGPRAKGGFTEEQLEANVRERLQEVGLPQSAASKMPAELSGGMRKRVGLARALALHPDAMLYDEPTTGLDPIMTDVINELILQTRARRPMTSLIVTHEMRTVQKVADRAIMLFPRSRLLEDEPQAIYDGPAAGIDRAEDHRVSQFVRGEARDRVSEIRGEIGEPRA
jgi:phospholipid/cholesterol/gamma-HCH transport system ATP-binding protein